MTDLCPSCREPLDYPSGDGCAAMTKHTPTNKYQKHLEAMAEYRAFVADNPGSRPTRQQIAAWLQPGLEFLFGGSAKKGADQ